jgi:hypothetical protein
MKILVGSKYFFNNIEGFNPKDEDTVELVLVPHRFKNIMHIQGHGKCHFVWRKMNPEQFIQVTLRNNLPMEIGKFLVPEFNKCIGFNLSHLRRLKPLADKLEGKHYYEKVIYDAYMENGNFILTDDQRMKAYEEYKKYRN